MRIAVDAMGGDYAPEAIVEGAVQAAEEYGFTIILVGQEDRVRQELAKYKTDHLSIEVRHAPDIVEMHDLPSVALRRKKESSLHKAIYMTKNGEADAAVSAGNTGAGMAIAKVACRMLEGVERPALATVIPNVNGYMVLIDVGANVDCKPMHLLQFAVMGHVYAQSVVGIENPRIGLLSVGEEDSKGNTLTKEVFEPLSQSKLNFIGNAEGRDVFNGRMDVIVCDGFIGNVVLKVSESLAKTMGLFMKDAFSKNWRTKLGYLLVKPGIEEMKTRMDYEEYGGAPLLGINGVVIISHGSSKARATKNAIRVAAESVSHHINDQIVEIMNASGFDLKSYTKATSIWHQLTRSIRHEPPKDQKEEPHPHEPNQPQPASDTAPLPEFQPYEEPEQERKYWWQKKQRHAESLKEADAPAPSLADAPAASLPALPEAQEIKDAERFSEDSRDVTSQKKSWWKRRDASRPANEVAQPSSEAQTVDDAPPPAKE